MTSDLRLLLNTWEIFNCGDTWEADKSMIIYTMKGERGAFYLPMVYKNKPIEINQDC